MTNFAASAGGTLIGVIIMILVLATFGCQMGIIR